MELGKFSEVVFVLKGGYKIKVKPEFNLGKIGEENIVADSHDVLIRHKNGDLTIIPRGAILYVDCRGLKEEAEGRG